MKKIIKFLKKSTIVFLISTLMGTFFTGCSSISEIDGLGIILAMGIDSGGEDNYSVSVQMLNVDNEVSNSQIDSKVFTSTGKTIMNALYSINKRIGKNLNYSHMQYLVIGDELARKGIDQVIDFSLRFNQVRPNIPMFVTKNKAKEILNTKVSTNVISAFAVRDLIDIQKNAGYAEITSSLDYVDSTHTGSGDTVIGEIEIDNLKTNQNEKNYNLSGSAVFKKDKLVGYLSAEETRGLNWIKGNIRSGDIEIEYANSKISFDIKASSSKIYTYVNDNKNVNAKVEINVRSNISEMPSNINPNDKPQVLDKLEMKENKIIYSEVNMALYKTQKEFSADVFGFGSNLYARDYNKWSDIEKKWDEQFKNININVIVNSNIKQTGTVSQSPSK